MLRGNQRGPGIDEVLLLQEDIVDGAQAKTGLLADALDRGAPAATWVWVARICAFAASNCPHAVTAPAWTWSRAVSRSMRFSNMLAASAALLPRDNRPCAAFKFRAFLLLR
jgi:hypothetical protein